MRSKRRRERAKSRPSDVFRLINKNLGINWFACVFSGLIFIPQMYIGFEYGFALLNSFIALFMGLIFIQSIRSISKLRGLKKMLLINPHSVSLKHISSAPNIKSLFWYS